MLPRVIKRVDLERDDLLRLAAGQSAKVQLIACICACERAFPLVNRLGSPKSRLVIRFAIEELWTGESGSPFLEMVRTLPEVAAWDTNDPAYYAMSGISIVAHTHQFLESRSEENLAYAIGTLFDLATEWGDREREITCQQLIYQRAKGQADPDFVTRQWLRMESQRAAFDYSQSVDHFCRIRGWSRH